MSPRIRVFPYPHICELFVRVCLCILSCVSSHRLVRVSWFPAPLLGYQ